MKHEKTSRSGKTLCGSSEKDFAQPTLVTCPKCSKIADKNHQNDVVTYYYGYYLVGFDKNNQIKSLDGSHNLQKEVQKALELYNRLHLRDDDMTYKMAYLKETHHFKRNWEIGKHTGQGLQDAFEKGLLVLKEVPTKHTIKLNEEAIGLLAPAIKARKASK